MSSVDNSPWLRVIDEELIASHLGCIHEDDTYETAKRKMQTIINWNVSVATDPSTNGGYVLVPVEQAIKVVPIEKIPLSARSIARQPQQDMMQSYLDIV
jgi:hypothetical protein